MPNEDDAGAGVPPQAEKSEDMGIEGALTAATGVGLGAVVVMVGSGVAHASLDPQASILEKLDEAVVVAGCAGFGAACGAAGVDRLKAELMVEIGAGAEGFCGIDAGGEGSEKSNRPFEAGAAGLDAAGGGLAAKLKSPKSFEERGSGLV